MLYSAFLSGRFSGVVSARAQRLCPALVLSLALLACSDGAPNPQASNRPVLEIPATQTYSVGRIIEPLVFVNRGGAISGADACSVATNDGNSKLPEGLTLGAVMHENKLTCQITGTPLEPAIRTTYIITAFNDAGNTRATVSIAVRGAGPLEAPVLVNAPDQTLIVGQPVEPISFVNTGGSVSFGDVGADGCSVDTSAGKPALPAGLVLGTAMLNGRLTCQITGAAEAALTSPVVVSILAVNLAPGGAPSTATVSIAISEVAVAPTIAVMGSASEFTWSAGTDIPAIAFTRTGSAIVSCVSRPALPAGLEIDATTCAISGIPVSASASSVTGIHTIIATNSGGDSEAVMLTITVNPQAPALPTSAIAENAVDGVAIAGVVVSNSGGTPGACVFFDASAAPGSQELTTLGGLTIAVSGNDCAVNGTLTGTGTQTFTVRASNDGGASADVMLMFTVRPPPAPVLVAPTNPASLILTVDQPLTSAIVITNSSSGAAIGAGACEFVDAANPPQPLSPQTVDGLSIATGSNTCEISGTPDTVGTTTARVRAGGSNILVLTITVNPLAPTLAVPSVVAATEGAAIAEVVLSNSGGTPDACVFFDSSAAPGSQELTMLGGLTIAVSGNDCAVNGTLTGTGTQTFTVRASNDGGASADVTLSFTVQSAMIPNLAAPGSEDLTVTVDQTLDSPIVITNSNASATISANSCQFVDNAAPPQPLSSQTVDGLSISTGSNTCEIGGTPDTIGTTAVRVRAASASGNSNVLSLNIVVNDAKPIIAVVGGTSEFTATVGTAIAGISFTSTGGAIVSCASDPALPDGLEIDASTCAISGVPAGKSAQNMYSITATNTGGDSEAVVLTITVDSPPEVVVHFPTARSLTDSTTVEISGALELPTGVTVTSLMASVNAGAAASVTPNGAGEWSYTATLTESAANTVEFTLTDSRPGTTTASVVITHFTPPVPPMTEARGLALDAANNRAYVVDNDLHGVYLVDLTTGTNSVFSGGGTSGNMIGSGDGFSDDLEGGIAIDAANNRLLVTDDGSNSVVAVSLAESTLGDRSVLSGSTQSGPAITTPFGIAIDATGARAFITDTTARGVIAINLSDGNRTLISSASDGGRGTGLALRSPRDLAWDSANNRLFVIGTEPDDLVEIDVGTVATPGTGNRTAVANHSTTTSVTFASARGLAFDSTNNLVYVAESAGVEGIISVDVGTTATKGTRIVVSNADNGTGPAFTGGTNSRARGVVIDSANSRLLVADSEEDALVAVDLSEGNVGNRSFVQPVPPVLPSVGAGEALVSPVGVVLGNDGEALYIADDGTDSIISVDLKTGDRTSISSSDDTSPDYAGISLANLRGLGWNADGTTLLAPRNGIVAADDAVLAINPATGAATVIASGSMGMAISGAPNFGSPRGHIAALSATSILVADTFRDTLFMIDTSNGDRTALATASDAELEGIQSVITGAPDGTGTVGNALVVSGSGTVAGTLDAVSAVALNDGAITVLSSMTRSQGTGDDFDDPRALALDTEGERILVLDVGLDALVAVDLDTGNRTLLSDANSDNDNGNGDLLGLLDGVGGGAGIALDDERGVVYVVSEDSANVLMIDLGTGDQVIVSQ